jgi:hypothetical protein
MSKLGYDETNFTNAIADLGRCENETKDLIKQISVLKDNIKDLNAYKLKLENELYNYRIDNGDKSRTIELLNKEKSKPPDFSANFQKYYNKLKENYGGKKYNKNRTKRIKNKRIKNKSKGRNKK